MKHDLDPSAASGKLDQRGGDLQPLTPAFPPMAGHQQPMARSIVTQ